MEINMALTRATRAGGPSNYPYVANTVAEMKKIDAHNDGDLILLSGYYSPGDLGGGRFKYVAGDTTTPEDGGCYIRANNNKLYVRMLDAGVVTPHMFGCVPDGVFDQALNKSTGTDNTVRLQASLCFAHNEGMEYYIPAGAKFLTR
ncbi:MAG: hypothetical protein ACRC0J_05630, partial [Shewanella oncorhynchi]